jgi:hypothetical protein
VLPALKYTADEAFAIGQDITTINEFVRQAIAEFVVGTRDVHSDAAWNAYLSDLNRMNLPRWITTAQAAFNRLKK